jgi:hypothetical protein
MKLKDHIKIRKIGTEYIIVNANGTNVDFTQVMKMNASAAYLLTEIQDKSFLKEELVVLLMQKYIVDEDIANKEVHELLLKLINADIITP